MIVSLSSPDKSFSSRSSLARQCEQGIFELHKEQKKGEGKLNNSLHVSPWLDANVNACAKRATVFLP